MNALTYIMAFKNGRGGEPGIRIWTSYFQQRVVDDSGTIESANCVTRAMVRLGVVSYYDLFRLHKNRMVDDGATFDNPCFDELLYTLVLLK